MRFHRRYPLLQTWSTDPAQRAVIAAENLCMARFEPAMLDVLGSGVVDLMFSSGERIAVVPFLQVSSEMLLQRENTPLLWPHACSDFAAETLEALEDAVLPWLTSLTLARQLNREVVRRFTDAIDSAVFESAREGKFLGAAPYRGAAADWAPYIYALRFARGRQVVIQDPFGATGAALCRCAASSVAASLENSEREKLAQRWFGTVGYGKLPPTADVAIYADEVAPASASIEIALDRMLPGGREVRVARPVPIDVLFSFNVEDSTSARSFSVRTDEKERRLHAWVPAAEPISDGGSSGAILMLLRDDWQRAPDADTDEAKALAARLEREGFAVTFQSASGARVYDKSVDLVHAFTARSAGQFQEPLTRFKARGVPVVVSPAIPLGTQQTVQVPTLLRRLFASGYEAQLEEHLGVLDVVPPQPLAGRDEAVAAVLQRADTVIAGTAAEEAHIKNQYGYAGLIVTSAPYVTKPPVHCVQTLVGTEAYVFSYTRIEARANLALLARAAAEQDRTLAVAGPVIEFDAYRALREILLERFVYCGEPAEAELGGLYSCARVYADVSWGHYGGSRAAMAYAFGCPMVMAQGLSGADFPGAFCTNPASITSMHAALARAWESEPPRPVYDSNRAFLSVISAYAGAQKRANTPA